MRTLYNLAVAVGYIEQTALINGRELLGVKSMGMACGMG